MESFTLFIWKKRKKYVFLQWKYAYEPIFSMYKLFYELLQVATGQLDCLSRGPSPEEWHELYETAARQQTTAIAYRGVEKLFEFGLRAPQDLAIDWMAEAEESTDYRDGELQLPLCPPVKSDNYRDRVSSPTVQALLMIKRLRTDFYDHRANLRQLLDLFFVLQRAKGNFEPLADGTTLQKALRRPGLMRFAQGVMWMLQEVLALDRSYMPLAPREREGRFVLDDIMSERRQLLHFVRNYPWLMLVS